MPSCLSLYQAPYGVSGAGGAGEKMAPVKGRVFDHLQEVFGGPDAQLFLGMETGRDGDRAYDCQIGIVYADYGKIPGDPDAPFHGQLDQLESHFVIVAQNAGISFQAFKERICSSAKIPALEAVQPEEALVIQRQPCG